MGAEPLDVIIVEVGERRFAIDLDLVDEVVPLGPITPVPSAPPVVAGAVNVRGEVCPVLHLERAPGVDCPSPAQPRRGQAGLLTSAAGYRAVLYTRRLREVARLEPGDREVELLDPGALLLDCAAQMSVAAGGDAGVDNR
jgi:chemotaxis signal transduction protein